MSQQVLTLPYPVSKNRRVKLRRRRVWKNGQFVVKNVVGSSEEWVAWIQEVSLRVAALLVETIEHPEEHERIIIECEWYRPRINADCINGHCILADAVMKAIDIDDRWFLIRDSWSYIDRKNPRVLIKIWKEKRVDPEKKKAEKE